LEKDELEEVEQDETILQVQANATSRVIFDAK
jgi:hypothetical protein